MKDPGETREELLGELETARARVAELERAASQQARAELELRRRAAEREAMFRAFPDLSFRIARDGTILDYHGGRSADLYAPPEAFLGKTVHDVLPSDVAEEHMRCLRRALEGEIVTLVYTLSVAGEDKVFEGRFIRIEDDQVYDVVRDITDRVRGEEERLALVAQVQQAQKLESLGLLAGGIAHDFNNLLCVILGLATLAARALPEGSPARPHLEEIEGMTRRAADLANQMLAYAGRGRFHLEEVALGAVVDELGPRLRRGLSPRGGLTIEAAEDLPLVRGDVTQLRQLITNLVTNASEALGDEAGAIVLRLSCVEHDPAQRPAWFPPDAALRAGPCVLLEIVDDGCGMDEETLGKIFDPFFTTKFTGRGLGLAAVFGIVRGHGGVIAVESAVGRGTAVRVMLPAAEPAEGAPTRPSDPDLSTDLGGGTILLVDDEDMVRKVVEPLLEALGFAVVTAASGPEAIEVFRARAGDIVCVILDYTMPGMDGAETLPALRAIRGDVPVLIASGYAEVTVSERFTEAGPSGFIHKPFSLDELRKKVREVLSG
ncbi:MAG: response regulator [Myxococcales bacterium]|nr:response regulator [Myxococcales bacterium]